VADFFTIYVTYMMQAIKLLNIQLVSIIIIIKIKLAEFFISFQFQNIISDAVVSVHGQS